MSRVLQVYVRRVGFVSPEEEEIIRMLHNQVDNEYDADIIAIAGDGYVSQQEILRYICLGKLVGNINIKTFQN